MERFLQTHDPSCWGTVLDFLQLFQKYSSSQGVLKNLIHKYGACKRIQAKEISREERARRGEVPAPVREVIPTDPLGKCPRCNDWIAGLRLPGCEARKTGRLYYKECRKCTYYSEIFKRKGQLVEIEGGE